jgi:hypothetical protein
MAKKKADIASGASELRIWQEREAARNVLQEHGKGEVS